jgi:hypothetical protein
VENIFSANNNISQNDLVFVTLPSGFCFYTESKLLARQEALLSQLKSPPHPLVVIRNQLLAFTLLHVLGSCSHLPEVQPLPIQQPTTVHRVSAVEADPLTVSTARPSQPQHI